MARRRESGNFVPVRSQHASPASPAQYSTGCHRIPAGHPRTARPGSLAGPDLPPLARAADRRLCWRGRLLRHLRFPDDCPSRWPPAADGPGSGRILGASDPAAAAGVVPGARGNCCGRAAARGADTMGSDRPADHGVCPVRAELGASRQRGGLLGGRQCANSHATFLVTLA